VGTEPCSRPLLETAIVRSVDRHHRAAAHRSRGRHRSRILPKIVTGRGGGEDRAAGLEDMGRCASADGSTHIEPLPAQVAGMTPIALAETAGDIAYVRASYVLLEELARARGIPIEELRAWSGTRLPRATYALRSGELRYAPDWWRLYDDAGSIDGVQPLFERRLRAAAVALDHPVDPAAEWASYLGGFYGACLRDAIPEMIVAKERLVARLDRALGDARPADPVWCEELRADVEALDGLTRPFAACDRARFGRPTSRDRLIDGARRAYPQVFTNDPTETAFPGVMARY
jgi:hypothetical protein